MSKPLSLEEFFRNFETHVSEMASKSGSMSTEMIWDLPVNSIASSENMESVELLFEKCINRDKQYSDSDKQNSVFKKLIALRAYVATNYDAERVLERSGDLYILDNCIQAVKDKISLSHSGLIILNKIHEKYT